jgi:hypothetical protein
VVRRVIRSGENAEYYSKSFVILRRRVATIYDSCVLHLITAVYNNNNNKYNIIIMVLLLLRHAGRETRRVRREWIYDQRFRLCVYSSRAAGRSEDENTFNIMLQYILYKI